MKVDRSSNIDYIERAYRMNIVLKVFYKNFRGWFYMKRYENLLNIKSVILALLLFNLVACAGSNRATNYRDPDMDFAALRTVAVMPFANLTRDKLAGERVRDTFVNNLLSTGALYVIPSGEVARAILRSGVLNPAEPSLEEISKLAAILRVDALITGVVREYGEVRSGTSSANVVSMSLEMFEVQSKKIVWTGSTTKGGISFADRLLGSGGQPMNDVTEMAINDILNQLFK